MRWLGGGTPRFSSEQTAPGEAVAFGPPQRGSSPFLAKWLGGRNLSIVIDRHRRHYRQMAASIPAELLCREWDDDMELKSAPIALPIMDTSRDADLVERLRASGIGAYAWPGDELPVVVRGRYPEAERLARRLVMLPIHYGLTEADLAYVTSVVRANVSEMKHGSEYACN